MNLNFRTIGKAGFLLVIIGFFMPIISRMNGFQLANRLIEMKNVTIIGIILYLLFVSAVIGLITGVLVLLKKNISVVLDWIIVIICIGAGFGFYFMFKSNRMLGRINLQASAYLIISGWFITLIAQIISKLKNETVNEKNIANKNYSQKDYNYGGGSMLEFVARVFRGWMNVLLWLILIACVIGGFVAGGTLLGGWGFSFGYAILGLIVGGLIGLITIILSGGLIANFLNMVDDISSIKYHLSKNGNTIGGNSSGINLSNISPITPTVNAADSWVCKKCSERNSNNSTSCKSCGAYK